MSQVSTTAYKRAASEMQLRKKLIGARSRRPFRLLESATAAPIAQSALDVNTARVNAMYHRKTNSAVKR
ncbi:hypothetical protein [Pseudomonas syringae]|uniref:hypothetical protein n=1 Tax=Pseudomonas syringae TaxID=317 RepID=UPI0012B2C695|nr:hypothetical protein [Pseudomonas syringae]